VSSTIIVHGDRAEIDAYALTWEEHGLSFAWGSCGALIRGGSADLGVIHYTAAENSAPQVFRTLSYRGLSVHFVVDRDGIIHQFADPANTRCSHAGGRANTRSVGIEVVSYGHARGAVHTPDPQRPTYRGTVHGWTTTIADFYPCQYDALDALCRAISGRLPIDLAVPDHPDERLSRVDLAAFHGWCGHYHVERLAKEHPKIDPGPGVFAELGRRWAK